MNRTPTLMPILSPGRHRSAKQGACFMEFASYLAGERWSDHPACTHPLLAALARDVNDMTTDDGRSHLIPLVHRVVGLASDDPALASVITVRAACAALPVASMERQRAIAAGLLIRLQRVSSPELHTLAGAALATTPDAERWARDFLATERVNTGHPHRGADEAMVHTSVVGIALACYGPDEKTADERLVALLSEAIRDSEALSVAPVAVPARPLSPAF